MIPTLNSGAAPVLSPSRLASVVLFLPSLLASQATSTPLLVLGVSLPGPSPVLFAQIQDAVPTADGGVVVLDLGNHALYRFDAAGRLLDSLGRRGRGPGEFAVPAALMRTADGRMGILDITLRGVLWWDRQGRHQSQASLPADWAPVDMQGGNENVAWIKSQRYQDNQFVFGTVGLGRASVDSTMQITTPAGLPVRGLAMTCTYCPWTPWPGGGVVVAAGDTLYTLTHLAPDGQSGRVWGRRVPAKRRSAEEIRVLAGQLRRGPGSGASSPEGGRGAPAVSPWAPRVAAVAVDDHGRLWALVYHGGETQAVLDVFSPDGAYLATVRPAPGVQRMRIEGNRLVAWGLDASDEPTVWAYRIEG